MPAIANSSPSASARRNSASTSWRVREIRGWTPATPLPHAPGYVRGVINLRGAVLPIVDLAARLGFGLDRADARATSSSSRRFGSRSSACWSTRSPTS